MTHMTCKMYRLMNDLRLPHRLKFGGYWFERDEMLIILLRRLSSVITFSDMEHEIGRPATQICQCFNGMITWMLTNHGWLIGGMCYYIINICSY